MAKFMFLARGDGKCVKDQPAEQRHQAMQDWGEWIEGGLKAGWLLDPGDGLKSAGKVVHADRTVTDGPFAESKELVGGYCMVEAPDLDAAVKLALTMPATDAAMEVRELAGNGVD